MCSKQKAKLEKEQWWIDIYFNNQELYTGSAMKHHRIIGI